MPPTTTSLRRDSMFAAGLFSHHSADLVGDGERRASDKARGTPRTLTLAEKKTLVMAIASNWMQDVSV
jgi:hypothetical protein